MGIEWNASYSVGVDAIDVQHRELFRRVSDLVEAMRHAAGKDGVSQTLDFLGDYVVDHFSNEARLMAEHRYPGRAAHLAEHAVFLTTLEQLRQRFQLEGPSARLAMEVNNKVCDWLVKHVLRTDKALGAFLATKGK